MQRSMNEDKAAESSEGEEAHMQQLEVLKAEAWAIRAV
jgi:hypothetical protein